MNSAELLDTLNQAATSGTAAIRAVTKLEPVDGPGGKVAPPTYSGGAYAFEKRVRNGKTVETVLLDSPQSQANRFEEVLLAAFRQGRLNLPVFEMKVGEHEVTSLTIPHRVHDAILRDSLWNGKPFRESDDGKRIAAARAWSATAFYEYAPTVLLFGTWDSQSGSGVNTAKIARSLVSEIVAFEAVRGVRTSSRIDPLGIKKVGDVVLKTGGPEVWRFLETKSKKGTVRPSEINHGNIAPSITDPLTESGGVTFEYAEQTTVLSFTQLRKLRFPGADDSLSAERDIAGRTVVAALGLLAVALQWEDGFQLRSRCQLIPVERPRLELIGQTVSDRQEFEIDVNTAERTLQDAVSAAEWAGLAWHAGSIVLEPRADLLKLVEYSDRAVEAPEGE